MRGFKIANANLSTLVRQAREQLGELEAALKRTPARDSCPVSASRVSSFRAGATPRAGGTRG
jgi:hypothetical protein